MPTISRPSTAPAAAVPLPSLGSCRRGRRVAQAQEHLARPGAGAGRLSIRTVPSPVQAATVIVAASRGAVVWISGLMFGVNRSCRIESVSMSSGRRAVRRPRRVQVHFWKQGDPTPHIGYTANISLTGMFIVTNTPLSSGSRIRVELVDRERGFMVEGVVAHARKMAPALAASTSRGWGCAF